jgi:hypothetical protein
MAKRIYKKVIAKMRYRRSYPKKNMADSQFVKCYLETNMGVQYASTNTQPTFSTSLRYYNFRDICGDSNSFLQMNGDFQRLKLTRLEIFVSDATNMDYISQSFNSRAAPVICFVPYVTRTSVDMGPAPLQTDDCLVHYCGSQKIAYKAWDFKSKYVDKSSLSAGQWIDPLSYTSYVGQLSVGNISTLPCTTGLRVANARIRMTAIFASRVS